MKTHTIFHSLTCLTTLSGVGLALPTDNTDAYANWQRSGADDVSRNGLNFTREAIVRGFAEALDFDDESSNSFFDLGITSNPDPNATTFDLNVLSRHNVLEKDASLSRIDAYFGDQRRFNATIFNETRSWWRGDTIDSDMLINSRFSRLLSSRRDNPSFRFTNAASDISFGEIASMFLVFGNPLAVTANRSWVEYFFENERFPTELGWRPRPQISNETVNGAMGKFIIPTLQNSVSFLTEAPAKTEQKRSLVQDLGTFYLH